MDYNIIYYFANMTGLCEKALLSSLPKEKYRLLNSYAAASVNILGNFLSGVFQQANLLFIITPVNDMGSKGILSVLSKAISPDKNVRFNKILDSKFNKLTLGYIITCDNQVIVALNDDASSISDAVNNKACKFIENFFNMEDAAE